MKRSIKCFSILVLVGVTTSICGFAQTGQSGDRFLFRDSTERVLGDSLAAAPAILDSTETFSSSVVDSLKSIIKMSGALVASKNSQIDSLISIISSKDVEIKRLTEERAFVDTCMARLANRWLYEKFNERDVNEAIDYFNRILSTQLRRDRSVILELLKNYKSAHNSFQTILLAAQRDPDRENPFSVSDYKSVYKSRIQSMPYYTKYYNGSWNIRYLNEQIKIALDRIDAHSDTKPADFSDLID